MTRPTHHPPDLREKQRSPVNSNVPDGPLFEVVHFR